MAIAQKPDPVKLFCGIITGEISLIGEISAVLEGRYGRIDKVSEVIPFDSTSYYNAEMGQGLMRQFISFAELIDPGVLADVKMFTNELELNYSVERDGKSSRRINLDPGYVAPHGIVLATAKNFAHRIYLRDGIYAEMTLNFTSGGGFRCFDWTYPDFKSPEYQRYFLELRRKVVLS
jgi:hypothetical protein